MGLTTHTYAFIMMSDTSCTPVSSMGQMKSLIPRQYGG